MPPKREKKPLFEPKDLVLAKMTGFPAWPLFVMPPEMIPGPIMKAKKKTTNLCVIFIPDGDFNWMNEKSLEALTRDKLEAKLSKLPKDKLRAKPKSKPGRTNNVAEALVAANGLDFDEFMDELAQKNKEASSDVDDDDDDDADPVEPDQDEPIEDDDDEDAAQDGSISEDMSKKALKNGGGDLAASSAPLDDELDGVDDVEDSRDLENDATSGDDDDKKSDVADEHDAAESEPLPRKRTRGGRTHADPVSKKPTPAPSNGASKNGKAASAEPAAVRKDARSSSPKPMTEKDRQHQLWLCRIKLQRSLIQRNQSVTPKDPTVFPPPTVDELLVARIILHRLADFPVNVDLLRETKIHKVIRCILKDEDLEFPDSFRLHEKCEELLLKWKDIIEDLKLEKQAKLGSRLSSQPLDDADMSGIDSKRGLAEDLEKVKV